MEGDGQSSDRPDTSGVLRGVTGLEDRSRAIPPCSLARSGDKLDEEARALLPTGSGAGRVKGRTFRLGIISPVGTVGETVMSGEKADLGDAESPFICGGFLSGVAGGFWAYNCALSSKIPLSRR